MVVARFWVVLLVAGTFLSLSAPGAGTPGGESSAKAVAALTQALEPGKTDLIALADMPFASVPLTRQDAARARALLWKSRVAALKKERGAELQAKEIKLGSQTMPFFHQDIWRNTSRWAQPVDFDAWWWRCTRPGQ